MLGRRGEDGLELLLLICPWGSHIFQVFPRTCSYAGRKSPMPSPAACTHPRFRNTLLAHSSHPISPPSSAAILSSHLPMSPPRPLQFAYGFGVRLHLSIRTAEITDNAMVQLSDLIKAASATVRSCTRNSATSCVSFIYFCPEIDLDRCPQEFKYPP